MESPVIRRKDVTISDIAKTAGVSIATVSRVLNRKGTVRKETYERVSAALREAGYETDRTEAKAAPLRGKKKLLLINIPSVSNPFFDEIIKGARSSVLQHNCTLLISESVINPLTVDRLLDVVRENEVEGMITCSNMDDLSCRRLADAVPVVQCTEFNKGLGLPCVSVDDYASGKTAVEHLIANGRKRIAILGALSDPRMFTCTRLRSDGYLAALAEAGLEARPEYMIHLTGDSPDLAMSAVLQLLRLPEPPDAIFATADFFCPSIIRACHLSRKRVPEDLAIVGYDNLELSRFLVPAITTISQPRMQLGFMAAEMLLERINNPATPAKSVLLDTELIVRESSVVS